MVVRYVGVRKTACSQGSPMMSEKRFTTGPEWVVIADGIATVGMTHETQGALGDIVFVDLPPVGRTLRKGETAALVESLKAATEVCAPLSGIVTESNAALLNDAGLLNRDAEGTGWIFRMTVTNPVDVAGE